MHADFRAVPFPESRVLAAVLRRMLRGEPVSAVMLSADTGLTPAEVQAALLALHEAGALYLRDGRVVAAYPLSGVPTRHRLSVRQVTAYANCAVDALAVPFMVEDAVAIDSACSHCGEPITIQMRGEHVLSARPRAPVVYVVSSACCEPGPAVLTRCPHINFFCDVAHAEAWQQAHPDRPGTVLSLADATARARERFAAVIRAVRGGDVLLADLSRHASNP